MGQPVVHFEVIGKDGEQLQRFYADLFSWRIDADNPLKYGSVEDAGITGGIGSGPAPVPGTQIELGQFTDPEGHLIGLMKSAD